MDSVQTFVLGMALLIRDHQELSVAGQGFAYRMADGQTRVLVVDFAVLVAGLSLAFHVLVGS